MLRKFKEYTPKIGNTTYVDPQALVIGQATLGDDCSVWPNVVIRADVNTVTVGDKTNIQDGSILHVNHAGSFNPKGNPLIIGNQVTIGHKVMLHGCILKDLCLIGMGAIIMDDAIINQHVIVGAGGLVPSNKELESGYLYVGSPVRKVRALTDEEKQYLEYSADHYAQLKNHYMANC